MTKQDKLVILQDGFEVNGCAFHVDHKYKPIGAIGKGSYGVVCSAKDTVAKHKVAIKKIKPMAEDEWDATHTLREIRLMRCLGGHENVSGQGQAQSFRVVILLDHFTQRFEHGSRQNEFVHDDGAGGYRSASPFAK